MIYEGEEYRPIEGTDGRYMVSRTGGVISVYARRNVNGHPSESYMPKRMRTGDNGNGYKMFIARINNRRKAIYVHRAVAMAFLERIPGKDYVNHVDFDKSNNNVENLEWCTQRENIRHSAHRMEHEHGGNTRTATGLKHIGFRSKKGKYRLIIQRKNMSIDKQFKTIDEAIEYRDAILGKNRG